MWDPFRAHREHVRQVMRSFSDPFGRDPFFSATDGRERASDQRGSSQMALRDDHRGMSRSLVPFDSFGGMDRNVRDPFSMMNNMMAAMRNNMFDMHGNIEHVSADPSAHSFSSSSVMTYSKQGDEAPKVFQASSQTRSVPGGVKETRKAVKDSESGVERMAIGHHIKDRAHIVEKCKNKKTGQNEMKQDFVNLDEAEAQLFDDEWQRNVSKFMPSGSSTRLEAPKHRSVHHAAVMNDENPGRREKTYPKTPVGDSRRRKVSVEGLNVQGSSVKANKK
nr:PREDICTED: myeloid leukemia factor 1 isoform X2 [Latimeria chalumnae]|eukprot:XP_014347574.1 PREDICTED: myeloid leukemia factor 1 isoform X2 [Latimeria chalumnae]